MFLIFWALYFGFFYVSLHPPWCSLKRESELTAITDQHLRPQSNRLLRPRISKPPPHPQRRWYPRPSAPGLRLRPLVRPHQPLHPPLHHPGPHDLLLDGSQHPRRYLRFRCRLRALNRRRAGHLRWRAGFADEGSEQDRDALWDGVFDPGVCDVDGAADCGGAD